MKKLKHITRLFNTIYLLMVILFFLDLFSILEIKGEDLKSFIHLGSLFGIFLVVPYNLLVYKSKIWNISVSAAALSVVICFSVIISQHGVLRYMFRLSSWNTQTVLYENSNSSFKKIEFQMQDVGALGYNERYVSVTYITPWFMMTKEIDPKKTFGPEWKKVNKNVNELGIVD